MQSEQFALFVSISEAVRNAERALDRCDAADCVDWLATVQLKTAELVTTLVTRIQNKPY